jgi:AcrR family transcriptional regulator
VNDTKKKGRPKKFNRETALQAALTVFWKKGYDGASVKDLTDSMGINAPSLYSTFGDKHSLYLQTIESYVSKNACDPLLALENEPDILLAVQSFYHSIIDDATINKNGATGCFLSSCVATTSRVVEGVQPLVRDAIETADTRIALRFELEKQKGTLPPDFPSLERARLMFDLRQGYVFRARAGEDNESLKKEVESRAKMILYGL